MAGVHLRELLASYGYPLLFLGTVIEGTGVPAPIELLILAAGYLIAAGTMNVAAVWVTVTVGNTIGNSLGYLLGRQGGRPLFTWVAQRLGLSSAEIARAENWFARYGGITQAFSRWIGITRTPAILGAGVTRMPFLSFVGWSIFGDGVWALFWTLVAA
ncbi:SNARE associated protein, partial [mine drainage metagenome]